ncbi:MAG: hypothetical protein AB8I08_06050 [Sandaracinaceae bacterium]
MKPVAQTLAWAALAVAALQACAPSAIFELELDLPPAAPGARYVVVTAISDGQAFALAPAVELAPRCGRPDPAPVCALRTLDPDCSAVVSVVSDEAPAALTVELVFCDAPDCAVAGVTHRVEVERPFYPGRYTQGRVCVDRAPETETAQRIERCEVRCREGTSRESCRLDGTHFCE